MEEIPVIMITESSHSMDKDNTVHITFVEEQSPSNDMDSDLQDSARSSFISTNSSGTSGTSEADDFNYRDSVISCSSLDSMDGSMSMNGGLARVGSTRSMPPERTNVESDSEEIPHGLNIRDVVRKNLNRKTAVRRHHTLTPNSSPKVRERRNRSISNTEVPVQVLLEHAPKEYFTLSVELRSYSQTHQVEANKSTSLREAIKPILSRAQIDPRTIDVFIESSSTPTPLELLTFPLSGRHLYVRAKTGKNCYVSSPSFNRKSMEDSDKTTTIPMRKDMSKFLGVTQNVLQPSPPRQASQAQRKDLTKLLGINQPDTNSTKSRRNSVPALIPQVKDTAKEKIDPKLAALQEKLDDFLLNGLPDFPALLTFSTKRENDEECFTLETTWQELAESEDHATNLTKKEKDQQEAIWEIIKTEVNYIQNIRIIVDFYLCALINLQASLLLNEIETEKIFSNITAIETLHTKFWKEKLSNVVKKARMEKRIPSAVDLVEAFEGFPDLFAPYIKFCTDEADCLVYLREQIKVNEMLSFFIEWAQRHKDSKRRKLRDLLVYPMQRITKYPLLLQAVEKQTLNEQDQAIVKARISEVREFVMRVNHELRQEEERQKMERTIKRLEGYEVVSVPSGNDELAKLVEEHSSLDLWCSMPDAPPQHARWLLMQGSLKLRDGDTRVDAYGFLFTDMLIIAKQQKSKQCRIIKPPMRVDRIKVQELKDGSGFAMVHVDDYDCAVYGCVLSSSKTPSWLQKIQAAKELYRSICTYSSEYNSGEIDDGSGEPPTSPEAMVFMQSSAFPFMDNSPCSSPLNSPLLPVRHLLSVDLKRARSTSSLTSNTGAVSPVMELEEDEDEEVEKTVSDNGQELANPGDFEEEICNGESSDDTISSLSNDFTGLFPHRKRESLTQDTLGEMITSPDTSKPKEKTPSSPIAIAPKRPTNLLPVPVGTDFGTSPISPAADIISFDDDDDEETPAQDNLVYTFPESTSPKRKISYQTAQLNPVKKTAHKKRSNTSVGMRSKPDVVDKSKEVHSDKSKKNLIQRKLLPRKFSNAK